MTRRSSISAPSHSLSDFFDAKTTAYGEEIKTNYGVRHFKEIVEGLRSRLLLTQDPKQDDLVVQSAVFIRYSAIYTSLGSNLTATRHTHTLYERYKEKLVREEQKKSSVLIDIEKFRQFLNGEFIVVEKTIRDKEKTYDSLGQDFDKLKSFLKRKTKEGRLQRFEEKACQPFFRTEQQKANYESLQKLQQDLSAFAKKNAVILSSEPVKKIGGIDEEKLGDTISTLEKEVKDLSSANPIPSVAEVESLYLQIRTSMRCVEPLSVAMQSRMVGFYLRLQNAIVKIKISGIAKKIIDSDEAIQAQIKEFTDQLKLENKKLQEKGEQEKNELKETFAYAGGLRTESEKNLFNPNPSSKIDDIQDQLVRIEDITDLDKIEEDLFKFDPSDLKNMKRRIKLIVRYMQQIEPIIEKLCGEDKGFNDLHKMHQDFMKLVEALKIDFEIRIKLEDRTRLYAQFKIKESTDAIWEVLAHYIDPVLLARVSKLMDIEDEISRKSEQIKPGKLEENNNIQIRLQTLEAEKNRVREEIESHPQYSEVQHLLATAKIFQKTVRGKPLQIVQKEYPRLLENYQLWLNSVYMETERELRAYDDLLEMIDDNSASRHQSTSDRANLYTVRSRLRSLKIEELNLEIKLESQDSSKFYDSLGFLFSSAWDSRKGLNKLREIISTILEKIVNASKEQVELKLKVVKQLANDTDGFMLKFPSTQKTSATELSSIPHKKIRAFIEEEKLKASPGASLFNPLLPFILDFADAFKLLVERMDNMLVKMAGNKKLQGRGRDAVRESFGSELKAERDLFINSYAQLEQSARKLCAALSKQLIEAGNPDDTYGIRFYKILAQLCSVLAEYWMDLCQPCMNPTSGKAGSTMDWLQGRENDQETKLVASQWYKDFSTIREKFLTEEGEELPLPTPEIVISPLAPSVAPRTSILKAESRAGSRKSSQSSATDDVLGGDDKEVPGSGRSTSSDLLSVLEVRRLSISGRDSNIFSALQQPIPRLAPPPLLSLRQQKKNNDTSAGGCLPSDSSSHSSSASSSTSLSKKSFLADLSSNSTYSAGTDSSSTSTLTDIPHIS